MLNLLDTLLRHLFMTQVGGITENQVRFQPPDQDWRNYVSGLADNALNVYLVELRENRKLRSNERVRSFEAGWAYDEPAPTRLDCHYLITAWSPGSQQVEPTMDEHGLLYWVTAVLLQQAPLNPTRIYPAGDPALLAWPEKFRDVELPTAILPVENFPKYAEFWGTMGQIHPWKPAVYLVVTLPVTLRKEITGPLVITRTTEYRHTGQPATAAAWIQIGGQVLDAKNVPVAGAWVRVNETGQTDVADAQGRFRLDRLAAGTYTLTVRAVGYKEGKQTIQVPLSSGTYDVKLTHL